MNEEKKARGRIRLNTVDKVILVVVIILMVLMAILSIMSRFGLMLIDGSFYFLGAFAGVVILLGWGCYALVRAFKSRNVRLVVGTLAVVVMFLLTTIGISFISMFANISVPVEFDTIVNGDHTVVILRGFDLNEERVALRKAERLKNNPDAADEETTDDYGYHFYAYPKALGLFYRADAEVEGEVYIGQASNAQLMIEWTDENTAHLFVADPGIGDGGDLYLRF